MTLPIWAYALIGLPLCYGYVHYGDQILAHIYRNQSPRWRRLFLLCVWGMLVTLVLMVRVLVRGQF